MDRDDIINYLGKIGTNGSSEAIFLIERQAEAIRSLRGIVGKLCGAGTKSTNVVEFSDMCDNFMGDAYEALAQTKEFGE